MIKKPAHNCKITNAATSIKKREDLYITSYAEVKIAPVHESALNPLPYLFHAPDSLPSER